MKTLDEVIAELEDEGLFADALNYLKEYREKSHQLDIGIAENRRFFEQYGEEMQRIHEIEDEYHDLLLVALKRWTMKVTVEIDDYSKPAQPCIRVHNAWGDGTKVELEIKGERYIVSGEELISAVKRAMVGVLL